MYRVADVSTDSSTPSLHITPLVASSKVSIPADEQQTIPPTPSQSHPSIINPLYRIPPTHNSPTMPQDMPPTGGYEPVQYKRNLPARGFRPATYLIMVGAICTYGFWRVGQGIREQK